VVVQVEVKCFSNPARILFIIQLSLVHAVYLAKGRLHVR